jgi:hypothetical protein
MKKTLLLFALIFGKSMFAQLTVTPNPFNINSGTITVSYGATSDYILFDPQFDPNLVLYMGLETDGVANTWDYRDDWNNHNSLVALTWNDAASAYIATFDLKTHNFIQESSGSTMTLPNNTTVNNWYFIIRTIDGSRQSGDLSGTNYGFQPSTSLGVNDFNQMKNHFLVKNGVLSTDIVGQNTLEIFNISGQKLETILFENQSDMIEIPIKINQKGVYIAKISNANSQKTVKFIN